MSSRSVGSGCRRVLVLVLVASSNALRRARVVSLIRLRLAVYPSRVVASRSYTRLLAGVLVGVASPTHGRLDDRASARDHRK